MSLTFDHLLYAVGVEPASTHLVRHKDNRQGPKRSVYTLWRDQRSDFEIYQSIQGRRVFQVGNYVASFVATPQGETLLAGFYKVAGNTPAVAGTIDPFSGEDCTGLNQYDLESDSRLDQYVGKLAIEWGAGLRSWVQRGGRGAKTISAIKQVFEEERFPGYLRFLGTLSSIASVPSKWRERLTEAKGVYVLTCPHTKELYVGSATGEGGFYERWCQHAAKGGDAVQFRSKEPSDYQVSILEVAGSSMSDQDILHAEQLWMRKLQTREMGLNGGILYNAFNKFALQSDDVTYTIHKGVKYRNTPHGLVKIED